MNIDLFIWRPILEGVLTFTEIEELCDINDVADANEALDVKAIIANNKIKEENKENDIKNIIDQIRIQR